MLCESHRANTEITISSEKIVYLAQNAMIHPGMDCDWLLGGRDPCPVVLASWELLKKHYYRHVRLSKHQKHNVRCHIKKCNAPIHSSVDALRAHIEVSHMTRVNALCPINGCQSRVLYRSLVKHFLDEHRSLDGSTVKLHSKILRTLWLPFYPSEAILAPPPLPPQILPGCVLLTSKPVPIRQRPMITSPVPPPLSSPFSSPRKRLQRQIPTQSKEEEDNDASILEFDNLRGGHSKDELMELIVWRRPPEFDMDVSRPQRLHRAAVGEPPTSIFYDVFAERIDELERQSRLA